MEQTKLKETKQRNKTVGGTTSKGGLSTGGTKHEGCMHGMSGGWGGDLCMWGGVGGTGVLWYMYM